MGISKNDIMNKLDSLGVSYDKKATAYELKALCDEELAKLAMENSADVEKTDDDAQQHTPEVDELTDSETDTAAEKADCEKAPIETVEALVTCAQLALRSQPCKPTEGEEDNLLAILGKDSMVFVAVGGDKEWAYIPNLNGYVMRKFLAVA